MIVVRSSDEEERKFENPGESRVLEGEWQWGSGVCVDI
jgi:hypothetical protein